MLKDKTSSYCADTMLTPHSQESTIFMHQSEVCGQDDTSDRTAAAAHWQVEQGKETP